MSAKRSKTSSVFTIEHCNTTTTTAGSIADDSENDQSSYKDDSATFIRVLKQPSETASPSLLTRLINKDNSSSAEQRSTPLRLPGDRFSCHQMSSPQHQDRCLPSLFTDDSEMSNNNSLNVSVASVGVSTRYQSVIAASPPNKNGEGMTNNNMVTNGSTVTNGTTTAVGASPVVHRSPFGTKRGSDRLGKRSIDLSDGISQEEDKKRKKVRRSRSTMLAESSQVLQKSPGGVARRQPKANSSRRLSTPTDPSGIENPNIEDVITSTPIPTTSDTNAMTDVATSSFGTRSPSQDAVMTQSPSATLTPFQFVTDRVFRPLFSTFSSHRDMDNHQAVQHPVAAPNENDVSNGISSTNSHAGINPFVGLPSKLLGKKRDVSIGSNCQRRRPTASSSSSSLNLLQKFPNFLSSSSSGITLFSFAVNSRSLNVVDLPDLISENLGGKIIFATDEFFASAENMLKSTEPERRDNQYSPYGKMSDGWETRRRHEEGHDWCLIELGIPGRVRGVEVDTRHFSGNHALQFSIEAAYIPDLNQRKTFLDSLNQGCSEWHDELIRQIEVNSTLKKNSLEVYQSGRVGVCQSNVAIRIISEMLREQTQREPRQWRDLVGISQLRSGNSDEGERSKQLFSVVTNNNNNDTSTTITSSTASSDHDRSSDSYPPDVITHVRLNVFPDGGIARLRMYGSGTKTTKESELDNLAAISNGALALLCSDKHFGDPHHLLLNTIPENTGGGWITARSSERPPILECDPVTGCVTNLIGEECVIIRLGSRRNVTKLEIDTKHFIGNHPESVEVKGIDLADVGFEDLNKQREQLIQSSDRDSRWSTLLLRTKLRPNTNHIWYSRLVKRPRAKQQPESGSRRRGSKRDEDTDLTTHHSNTDSSVMVDDVGPVTHLCVTIYPDGGIARLRAFGKVVVAGKGS